MYTPKGKQIEAEEKNMTNYEKFVAELEKLSVKYGVVIQSVGGVDIYDEKLKKVEYDCDETSGDLIPLTVE